MANIYVRVACLSFFGNIHSFFEEAFAINPKFCYTVLQFL